jgi:regulator of RNase E activity RraA
VFEIIDSCEKGEVIVIDAGGYMSCDVWGGLTSTAAKVRGLAGAVVDGAVRDVSEIRELEFPVFAKGIVPASPTGRLQIMAHNITITCGGVLVNPGDIILGDDDGVVVIPKEKAEKVLELTKSLSQAEKKVKDAILRGVPSAKVIEERE